MQSNRGAYISIQDAKNVKILGSGTIDTNGMVAYSRNGRGETKIRAVNVFKSENVLFEDVLLRNSNSWAVHIMQSKDFTARNVKIFSGKDGFDPDSSHDVLIEHVFIQSYDDSIAVKARHPGWTTERITIRDSIVSSVKSALKIGTETRDLITDVTFDNIDVFDGERGIVLYGYDGGPIRDVTWKNIRLFMIDWSDERYSGSVFHFVLSLRDGPTTVENCVVENITANFIYSSEFGGFIGCPLTGVELRNITINVDPPKTGRPNLFSIGSVRDFTIDGLAINWQGNRDRWAGIGGSFINMENVVEYE